MEKLQSALQKARDQRTTEAADPEDIARQNAETLTAGDAPGVMAPAPEEPSKDDDTPHEPRPATGRAAGKAGRHMVKHTRSRAVVKAEWGRFDKREPDRKALIRNRIVTLDANDAAAPFDTLRTKILLEARRNDWTRIGITSPASQVGKTTIACNLALSMGRQEDTRSMLFEMDLRRPAMADMLGETPKNGIVEFLSGAVALADQGIRIGDNVMISAAREPVTDPGRYLLNHRTADIFDRVEAEYRPDLMFFDLPPMLGGDEARPFLRNVDAVIIVARAEHSTASQIDVCEKEVAQHSNVLGVVLSQYRFMAQGGADTF